MKSLSFKIVFSSLVLFFVVFNTSCKKEAEDITKPVITIAEPLEGASLSQADDPEVHVEFTVTDEASLHELSLEVKDAAGTVVFSDDTEVHDLKFYEYHEHFIPTGITNEMGMTLTITAEDHGSNVATKVVNFKVKP